MRFSLVDLLHFSLSREDATVSGTIFFGSGPRALIWGRAVRGPRALIWGVPWR